MHLLLAGEERRASSPGSSVRPGLRAVPTPRDPVLGVARPPAASHRALPRVVSGAVLCAPSVPGHLLTQNLEPSSPEPHRTSMGLGRGGEEGERVASPAREGAPGATAAPRAPPRSAP